MIQPITEIHYVRDIYISLYISRFGLRIFINKKDDLLFMIDMEPDDIYIYKDLWGDDIGYLRSENIKKIIKLVLEYFEKDTIDTIASLPSHRADELNSEWSWGIAYISVLNRLVIL